MIVRKDKSFLKCSDYPDTDWIGDADYILNDNDPKDAGLGELIMAMYPNFDIVEEDGHITDIIATEPIVKEVIPDPPTNEELAAALVELAEVIANG